MPARKAAPRTPVAQFVPEHKTTTLELDVERPSLHIAWVLPPSNTPEGEAAEFGLFSAFGRIFEAGKDYGFAYDVSPRVRRRRLAPVVIISIELKGLDKIDEALEFVKNAANQAYRGFDMESYADIEEDKARAKARFVEGMESLTGRTQQMASFVQFDTAFDFNSSQLYQFYELDKIDKFDSTKVGARDQERPRLGQVGDGHRQAEQRRHQGRQALEGHVPEQERYQDGRHRRRSDATRCGRSCSRAGHRRSPG